jgi:hypothetical protein
MRVVRIRQLLLFLYNAEFAAINDNGEEYDAYQAFRTQSKALAQGWAE